MICRQHSDAPREELKCQGPCNSVKPLDAYSKNSRRKGTNVCKRLRSPVALSLSCMACRACSYSAFCGLSCLLGSEELEFFLTVFSGALLALHGPPHAIRAKCLLRLRTIRCRTTSRTGSTPSWTSLTRCLILMKARFVLLIQMIFAILPQPC